MTADPTRRPHGSGTLRPRGKPDPTGRRPWQLRAYAGRDGDGVERYAYRTFRGTKREAAAALAAFVTETKAAAPLDVDDAPARRTVAELWDRYNEVVLPGLAPGTRTGYRRDWRNYVAPAIGHLRLDAIGVEDLERLYAELARRPRRRGGRGPVDGCLSAATVRHCHVVISAVLSAAVRWGWIDGPHAARRARAPKVPERTRPRAPKPEVVRAGLAAAAARDPELHAFVRVGAVTGARRGEVAGLRWDNLDLDARTASINTAVKVDWVETVGDGGATRRTKRIVVGPLKAHGERVVALDATTADLLRDLRADQAGRAAAAGIELAIDAFVFADDLDGRRPLDPDLWSRRWQTVARRIGHPEVRYHDLRHFVGVSLAPMGLRVVMDQLGHSRMTTTSIYQAVDANDAVAERLGHLLA